MRRGLALLAAAKQDLYKVLGVPESASVTDIKKAYKTKAAKLHPDVNKAANAADDFSALGSAYETLSDERRRRFYDYTGAPPAGEQEMKGFEDFVRQQPQQAHARAGGGAARAAPRGFHSPWEADAGDEAWYAYAAGPGAWERGEEPVFAEGWDPHSTFGAGEYSPFGDGFAGPQGPFGGPFGDPFGPFGGAFGDGAAGWQPPRAHQHAAKAKHAQAPRGDAARAAARGVDAKVDVRLTFREAAEGCTKQVTYKAPALCGTCGGAGAKGAHPGTQPSACPACQGRGAVVVQASPAEWFFAPCDMCGGLGEAPRPQCGACKGKGVVDKARALSLGIPPGVDADSTIRWEGQGGAGRRGGANGDLVARLHVDARHDTFARRGADLHCVLPVPAVTALVGGHAEVRGLGGGDPIAVAIPPGCPHGHRIELAGKGLWRHEKKEVRVTADGKPAGGGGGGGARFGSLFAHVALVMPAALTEEQRQLLIRVAELGGRPPSLPRKDLVELQKQLLPAASSEQQSQQKPPPQQQERDGGGGRRGGGAADAAGRGGRERGRGDDRGGRAPRSPRGGAGHRRDGAPPRGWERDGGTHRRNGHDDDPPRRHSGGARRSNFSGRRAYAD